MWGHFLRTPLFQNDIFKTCINIRAFFTKMINSRHFRNRIEGILKFFVYWRCNSMTREAQVWCVMRKRDTWITVICRRALLTFRILRAFFYKSFTEGIFCCYIRVMREYPLFVEGLLTFLLICWAFFTNHLLGHFLSFYEQRIFLNCHLFLIAF
jgi:hypothetical protein